MLKNIFKKHKETFIFFISIGVIILISVAMISAMKILKIYITPNNTEDYINKEDDGIKINYTKPLKDPLIIPAPK